MTLEQQVCSLELAKRLKELGVKQESYFWWISRMKGDEEESFIMTHTEWETYYKGEYGYVCLSAFTVAELGEILKELVNEVEYGFCHGITGWHFYKEKEDDHEYADTEADARAKCLIYLLENGLCQV
jgi:hypothetical protein